MNRRILFLGLALATFVATASAQTSISGGCNAARVSAGDCTDATHVFFLFSGPSVAMLDFRDTLTSSEEGDWQATVPCEAVRRLRSGVLQAAGVVEDTCTLGATVTNPQGRNSAAMNYLAVSLRRWQQRRTTPAPVVPTETTIGAVSVP